MVVDDTADVRELVALHLRALGYDVVEAADGREAVELVRLARPGLILMDLSMPVLDGFEVTRRIRGLAETRDVPVVAVTAFSEGDTRRRALEARCVDFVGKPVDFEALGGVLRARPLSSWGFLEGEPVINLPGQLHVSHTVVGDLPVTPFAESVVNTTAVHALGLGHPEPQYVC